MASHHTIGNVSRQTGLPIRTIRFYEAEGVLPAPARTPAGYRLYSRTDVRRLQLVRNARALGLGLAEIRALVEQAFASDCRSFAPQLRELIAAKRDGIAARIRELRDLEEELNELERHVQHAACATVPGQLVSECDYCPMIDEEGEIAMTKHDVQEAIELLNVAVRNGGQSEELMKRPDVIDALQVVGCDIGARPRGAPVLDDIKPYILNIRREPERLTVEFDARVAEQVKGFVAAEQKCCSDLRFSVLVGERAIMQIDMPTELVDAVAGWMTPA